jgi:hypothetical protein
METKFETSVVFAHWLLLPRGELRYFFNAPQNYNWRHDRLAPPAIISDNTTNILQLACCKEMYKPPAMTSRFILCRDQ